MNNKLLSAVLIAGITATGFASLSSANDDTQLTTEKTIKEEGFKGGKFGHNFQRGMHTISEEDKILIESMTDDEKKTYFEAKKSEGESERVLKESVIDDLLAGNILTAEQEVVRAEMITQRTEQKEKKLEMKSKMEEIKVIMEKKKAGEELSESEEEILTSLQSQHKGKRGGGFEQGKKMNKGEGQGEREFKGQREGKGQRGNK